MWKAGNNLFFQCIHVCICGCHCSACALCFLPFSLYFIPLFPVLLSSYTQVLALCFYVVYLLVTVCIKSIQILSTWLQSYLRGPHPIIDSSLVAPYMFIFLQPLAALPSSNYQVLHGQSYYCVFTMTSLDHYLHLSAKLTNRQNWEMKLM